MKWSNKKGLFPARVALTVAAFLSSAAASVAQPEGALTTLAIEVGSTATRLSVLVGDNGLAFGDNGDPKIIWSGPGTRSSPRPVESNWTAEGFLLIRDGTDETLYVHPSNTIFNVDHPIAWRSRYDYDSRPNITGHQTFTLIDITAKYLQELTTAAESILGHSFTSAAIVFPDGQNVRTVVQ
ncbi:hypothetical protein BGZ68_000652 [Mortierella alpina]|nr:hypothetical protein BGZ68_000652 [Mortierella alpina]